MTVREAVVAICSLEVPSNTVDVELINGNLDGDDEYNLSLKTAVSRTSINVLSALLGLSSFKEGDMTVQLDQAGIQARIRLIAGDNGFTDITESGKPKIRDRSGIW